MDPCLAPGLGGAVESVARIVERLIASDVALRREDLDRAARAIAAEEAPLDPGAAGRAVDALSGLGPLEALLADPETSDVLVNGPGAVWVERRGRLEQSAVTFPDAAAVVAAVERVIAPLGLRIDRASPAVDARLPDGSRLHAVIPPAAVDGPVVAVRRFIPAVSSLNALEAGGSVEAAGATLLRDLVRARASLLVSGGTGSGKTTLLNVLSREIPDGERIVTIEDAAELQISGHVVRLEGRPPNAEGRGEIALRTLLRHALRMRPDRIIVGEVRGPEAIDLIQAMTTGHAGSMGTVHANGPEEALWRLETLAMSGEQPLPPDAVRRQLHAAVDFVVHMERSGSARKVAAIVAVGPDRLEARYP
jgi:pilus assembly protein CpaF